MASQGSSSIGVNPRGMGLMVHLTLARLPGTTGGEALLKSPYPPNIQLRFA